MIWFLIGVAVGLGTAWLFTDGDCACEDDDAQWLAGYAAGKRNKR